MFKYLISLKLFLIIFSITTNCLGMSFKRIIPPIQPIKPIILNSGISASSGHSKQSRHVVTNINGNISEEYSETQTVYTDRGPKTTSKSWSKRNNQVTNNRSSTNDTSSSSKRHNTSIDYNYKLTLPAYPAIFGTLGIILLFGLYYKFFEPENKNQSADE